MKKTLIALTLAATGVSSGAYAAQTLQWQTGELTTNNAFNLGGTFYSANHFNGQWQWAVGTAIAGINSKLGDIVTTDNTYKLSIMMTSGYGYILLGKTERAFGSPLPGGVGAIPQITFKGADNTPVSIVPDTSTPGKGSITIPLMQGSTSTTTQQLGTAKLNISYAGLALDGTKNSSTDTAGAVTATSLYSAGATSGIFFGGLPTADTNVLNSASTALDLIAKFSGPAQSELVNQIKTALSLSAEPAVSLQTSASQENTQHDGITSVFAAAYALGFGPQQKLDLTFTNKPTATTEWKAPLQIEVSYN
ncbi:hypothetical protein A9798_08980 [Edwardsiella hoshinae]|uniref:Fimbrial protein n=1 Tax=Edwardsiella hoshinae TaxID=93378 RepID=A0ABN4SYK4_9GAMM|nr:hypothetical protein [Edwardsiella hoshinae]AOV97085.1 hypothetical protein A9798_08980 [Edwardsiella hoshinae]